MKGTSTRRQEGKFIGVMEDVKLSCEANTQPHYRQPPFRQSRSKKLIQSVMKVREDIPTSMPLDYMFFLWDGMKHGEQANGVRICRSRLARALRHIESAHRLPRKHSTPNTSGSITHWEVHCVFETMVCSGNSMRQHLQLLMLTSIARASEGNESAMLSVFQDLSEIKPKNMNKSIRKLYCNYSETSVRERLGSVKGSLHLMEMINVVTAAPVDYVEIEREALNAVSKTSRGDVIGTLSWHPWSKSWSVPVSEKRKLYGSVNRIEVGGAAPDGLGPFTRGPGDTEPVFFHQVPSALYRLVLVEHPIHGIFDLTPGAGMLAVEAVGKRIGGETEIGMTTQGSDLGVGEIFAAPNWSGRPRRPPTPFQMVVCEAPHLVEWLFAAPMKHTNDSGRPTNHVSKNPGVCQAIKCSLAGVGRIRKGRVSKSAFRAGLRPARGGLPD